MPLFLPACVFPQIPRTQLCIGHKNAATEMDKMPIFLKTACSYAQYAV